MCGALLGVLRGEQRLTCNNLPQATSYHTTEVNPMTLYAANMITSKKVFWPPLPTKLLLSVEKVSGGHWLLSRA